ncbi:MAG TPA: 4-(cytidine 5'-diphospho)-2-C-methyl-D-erythritol kinase [Burkholderiales bacterium]|nr:4-(cytidine 5'-diphospho)-2-C-methyl-D-erythritol kinase [Burkholderiales bacterium]
MTPGATFPAPAKLNLLLRVTGRRADGYHLLQTVFRFIDYSDALRFTLRADGAITRAAPVAGIAEDDDLTLRAARLLQRVGGAVHGAEIALDKKLPLGAGLGGGSSDAATTLLVLNRLWGLHLPRARLQQLALELGADVPVFVFGQNALGEGVGERLRPLALPLAWYIVLLPPVEVSTARIFQAADLKRDSNPIKIPPFSFTAGGNDLEPVVCRLYPEIGRHLQWLGRHAPAAVTGSGACVFAEFADEDAARAVLNQLPPDMRGVVARGLDRHPLWEIGD